MDATIIGALGFGALGFVLGAGLVWLISRARQAELKARLEAGEHMRTEMENQFEVTANRAVQNAHESFLKLAEARLKDAQKDGAHDLDKRHKAIDEMIKPVHENLKTLSGALEQMKGTDQALREDLKTLHKETSKLAGALKNPAARGNWGEGILTRLLENSGLIKGVHYTLQTTLPGEENRLRPDAIVNLPDSLHIVIDSKAPINDFIRNLDSDIDEADYHGLQTGLAQAVKGHINQLGKKAYWEQLNSPDFVVLFLPSEHLFSAAVQADPTLLDLAAEKKIVMASPILMMSLLRVVGMGWRQVELAKNAQVISDQGQELYKRLLKFTDHMGKIGKHLQNAMRGYDEATGSLERSVLPSARKFKDLQAGVQLEDVPDFTAIEQQPRVLNLSSEDEDALKKSA
ncbi:MAG: DNA recombination protein RmuC [Alphaproteobacteria bacterium]|nr:DNA recombination protein RmuC [Alphaproteobacteria bacterium]